jgi:1,4-alpha-glucan branching enzyme
MRLTFSLDDERPVSVVGDFNGWDPTAHPLKPRANGRRSIAVVLPSGSRHAFRYLAEGGVFFDDPDADAYEDNGYGEVHGLLMLAAPAARRRPSRAPAEV